MEDTSFGMISATLIAICAVGFLQAVIANDIEGLREDVLAERSYVGSLPCTLVGNHSGRQGHTILLLECPDSIEVESVAPWAEETH